MSCVLCGFEGEDGLDHDAFHLFYGPERVRISETTLARLGNRLQWYTNHSDESDERIREKLQKMHGFKTVAHWLRVHRVYGPPQHEDPSIQDYLRSDPENCGVYTLVSGLRDPKHPVEAMLAASEKRYDEYRQLRWTVKA